MIDETKLYWLLERQKNYKPQLLNILLKTIGMVNRGLLKNFEGKVLFCRDIETNKKIELNEDEIMWLIDKLNGITYEVYPKNGD